MNQNQQAADYSLRDLINLAIREVMLSLNSHHVGVVDSFNASEQTVSVKMAYKKSRKQLNQKTGLYDLVTQDYIPLVQCPVVILSGGGASLTFPIAKGDECLLLFNDRDLDNWFQGQTNLAPNTGRLHAFTDAIALVGLRSLRRSISGYDTSRAVLQNGETMVGVGPNLVKIANGTTTLKTLIEELITAVKNLSIDVSAIAPSGGSVSAASKAALDSVKSDIEGLLE